MINYNVIQWINSHMQFESTWGNLYVTHIGLCAPISRYSFIVQASISTCSLFNFQGRMCLEMIFNIFNRNLFILMWCIFIFFRVTWEWLSILFMYYFYFTYFKTRWFIDLLLFSMRKSFTTIDFLSDSILTVDLRSNADLCYSIVDFSAVIYIVRTFF